MDTIVGRPRGCYVIDHALADSLEIAVLFSIGRANMAQEWLTSFGFEGRHK